MAIGAVRALRKAGYKVEDAIEIVAQSYGVSEEAVRQWRKTWGKDPDPKVQLLMARLPSNYTNLGWTKEGLLKAVQQAGNAFNAAKKGK
jgi:hypothetical protein